MLDLRVEAPSVDGGLDKKILSVDELLSEFGNLRGYSQNDAALQPASDLMRRDDCVG